MAGNNPQQESSGNPERNRDPDDLAAATEFLSRPESYPEGTDTVEVKETHLSRLFLTDNYVYKLKKPLRYEFLDFTSREARLRNCETEVLINSELAPDVYQGVITLAEDDQGRLNLDGRGRPLDYLVKMRRLPDCQNLEVQMEDGTLNPDHIDRAARRLADFYADHPMDGPVRPDRFGEKVREQADELRNLPLDTGRALDDLEAGLLGLLRDHQEDLRQRRCRDVHGDLRPEHVYPTEDPAFLDRLEFNADLRLMDPLEELSFFAMECRRLDHGWVGERFIEVYEQVTGDHAAEHLIAIYTGYRALLWAVLKARHLERDDDRKPWGKLAREYLDLGLRALDQLH
ncbi:Aminoglycoside phosphotransferase family enzyme [Marinobacter daqiaonensis]|uniref:Aminoglycoside phosphotransferase family enzyme n=1 Tax=Marinobacter daqiaonensis TaxID=650891 RepID=A0A1I6H7A6_9GAMM|nr:hypothetical protein [Marinobacter daqiaonensis]SFR50426.1 Aminoglycoside phosphotransferase family enzyme [Marinobacter daqiaonensis]